MKPGASWQDPHEVDLAFARCLATLLGSGVHTVVATHEPVLLDLADGLADQSGRGPEGLEYQFFLGADPDLQLRTADAAEYSLGQDVTVEVFEAGQKVDVVGTTKGKGFAGAMKRHGFAGVGASHGQHKNHRKPGSVGGASTPGRVFKGQRMPGRMGAVRQTTMNLTLHGIDVENNLLLIKGAVPGSKGQVVLVRSAVKGA